MAEQLLEELRRGQQPGDGGNQQPAGQDSIIAEDQGPAPKDEPMPDVSEPACGPTMNGPEAAADAAPASVPSAGNAASQPAAVETPAEAPKRPGKEKDKGSRLAQDVHGDTVVACKGILHDVSTTLLGAAAESTAGAHAWPLLDFQDDYDHQFTQQHLARAKCQGQRLLMAPFAGMQFASPFTHLDCDASSERCLGQQLN